MINQPTTGQVQPRRLLPAAPRVVFIGSGPGESGLMTMRGAEILGTRELEGGLFQSWCKEYTSGAAP